MPRIRLTREFTFEASHALAGYDGLCSQIHGHSYRLLVTVIGEPSHDPCDPKFGMVMDFGLLKNIVNRELVNVYDHSIMIRRTGSNVEFLQALEKHFDRVHLVDFQPTCENLISLFADVIAGELPTGIELFSLRLHETATSFAEWFASDNLQ